MVMTDRYTMLTKAILAQKTNATAVAIIFLDHVVENFGISSKLLNNNGPQFVAVC